MVDEHPIAALFPMMEAEALAELAADIKANGLAEPITVYENLVLDGRNRLAACELAGVAPSFVAYEGDDPTGWVVSKNLRRRHLTPVQQTILMVQIEGLYQEQAEKSRTKAATQNLRRGTTKPQVSPTTADLHQSGNPTPPKKAPKRAPTALAKAVEAVGGGVSLRTVQKAKAVRKADPDAYARIAAGTATVDAAYRTVTEARAVTKQFMPEPERIRALALKIVSGFTASLTAYLAPREVGRAMVTNEDRRAIIQAAARVGDWFERVEANFPEAHHAKHPERSQAPTERCRHPVGRRLGDHCAQCGAKV